MTAPHNKRIFIPCVNKEFHHGWEEGKPWYQSYRTVLARELLQVGIAHVLQEQLDQGFGTLLNTLEDQVASTTYIAHIVGELAGKVPV